eukprot:Gregarina_sp_Poly_1__9470@NODE_594_length_7275_cov_67_691593_g459_i0_p4_GENE_NODE_594_length_7275_cov_67_691593_g459_i0NODE_594_length_7275_cov_67_691593_g459_i0_p4_ORF_typecomplete_len430_score37_04_NODE_594_length_7275_cov_67_691593_g459_i033014590
MLGCPVPLCAPVSSHSGVANLHRCPSSLHLSAFIPKAGASFVPSSAPLSGGPITCRQVPCSQHLDCYGGRQTLVTCECQQPESCGITAYPRVGYLEYSSTPLCCVQNECDEPVCDSVLGRRNASWGPGGWAPRVTLSPSNPFLQGDLPISDFHPPPLWVCQAPPAEMGFEDSDDEYDETEYGCFSSSVSATVSAASSATGEGRNQLGEPDRRSPSGPLGSYERQASRAGRVSSAESVGPSPVSHTGSQRDRQSGEQPRGAPLVERDEGPGRVGEVRTRRDSISSNRAIDAPAASAIKIVDRRAEKPRRQRIRNIDKQPAPEELIVTTYRRRLRHAGSSDETLPFHRSAHRQRQRSALVSRPYYHHELPTMNQLIECAVPEMFVPPCLSTTPRYHIVRSPGDGPRKSTTSDTGGRRSSESEAISVAKKLS